MSHAGKHIFACFTPHLSRSIAKDAATISDRELAMRVTSVLRLKPDDQVTLFDEEVVITGRLEYARAQEGIVRVIVEQTEVIVPLQLELTLYGALIKKDALEDVVYYATQTGVRYIHLVRTNKSTPLHGSWSKMQQRLRRVAIAAAEQSKQFALPRIFEPISFDVALRQSPEHSLVLSPDGDGLFEVLSDVHRAAMPQAVWCGPEGGFTDKEHAALAQDKAARFVRLTPSILRTQEAVMIALGAVRGVLS